VRTEKLKRGRGTGDRPIILRRLQRRQAGFSSKKRQLDVRVLDGSTSAGGKDDVVAFWKRYSMSRIATARGMLERMGKGDIIIIG